MSYYKTHEITLKNNYKIQLYRDLATDPGVSFFPIKRNSNRVSFQCSSELGIGFMNYTYTCTIVNDDADTFSSIFTKTNWYKTYLQIRNSAEGIVFTGRYQLSTLDSMLFRKKKEITITFVDAFYPNARMTFDRYYISGDNTNRDRFIRNSLIDDSILNDTIQYYHPWRPNDGTVFWTPGTGASQVWLYDSKMNDVFFNIQDGATHMDYLEAITQTTCSVFGWSSSKNEYVYILAYLMYNASSLSPNFNGIELSLYSPVATSVSKGIDGYSDIDIKESVLGVFPGFGLIDVHFQDTAPLSTFRDEGDDAKLLKEFIYSSPYQITSDTDPDRLTCSRADFNTFLCVYAQYVNQESPLLSYPFDFAGAFGRNILAASGQLVGTLKIRGGLIDPMFPFYTTTLINGDMKIWKIISGEWNLTELSTKVKVREIGVYIDN